MSLLLSWNLLLVFASFRKILRTTSVGQLAAFFCVRCSGSPSPLRNWRDWSKSSGLYDVEKTSRLNGFESKGKEVKWVGLMWHALRWLVSCGVICVCKSWPGFYQAKRCHPFGDLTPFRSSGNWKSFSSGQALNPTLVQWVISAVRAIDDSTILTWWLDATYAISGPILRPMKRWYI